MSSDKLLQGFSLFSAYHQFRWFWPFLHRFSSSFFPPILPHTDLSLHVLVLAEVLAIAGALIAGTFGSWRAARLRPAEALAKVA